MIPCNMKYSFSLLTGLKRPGDSLIYKTGLGTTGAYYHDDRGLRFNCNEEPIPLEEFRYGDKCVLYKYCDIFYSNLKSRCDEFQTKHMNILRSTRYECGYSKGYYNAHPIHDGLPSEKMKYILFNRRNQRFLK